MDNNYLYSPREFNSINLWKDISIQDWNNPLWQRRNSIKNIDKLKKVIKLTESQELAISDTINKLNSQGKESLRITPYYASLISQNPFETLDEGCSSNDNIDPIFWQSVPTPANLLFPNTGKEAAMDEGLRSFGAAYQRYPNRIALFVAENTSCATYCNHCQRSKSLDSNSDVSLNDLKKGLFYISFNKNINEVLVTGGDALMISKNRLKMILEELSKIPHIRSIRIATRTIVVLPMSINDEILDLIKISANKYNDGLEKYVYFMTHINHYKEITNDLFLASKKIREYGFSIRNQSVLLNHINDDFKTLAETFRRMFWVGIHPYYLLQCHKEKGIVHFITPIQIGKIYLKHLQGWISGVTVPRYAANIEGGGGKVLLMPSGHDTLNIKRKIDDSLSESYASIDTWDNKEIKFYEALGRASLNEYNEAVDIMDSFIGRKGVFRPSIIIVDDNGNHIFTTNKDKLPHLDTIIKSNLLEYDLFDESMPLTNPQFDLLNLEKEFRKSKYNS